MEEKNYRIVQVTLVTGRKLYGAKNGDAKFFDLDLGRNLENIEIPKEKIEIERPFAIACISEKPETTLDTFYTELILRGLISTLPLKACVITNDTGEFKNRMMDFQTFKGLEDTGGLTVDELIANKKWEFLALLAGGFIHLPSYVKTKVVQLIKKEAPQFEALTRISLSA